MEKKTIYEYDVLRVFATLLVVMGHSTYYIIATQYGGINYTLWMNQNNLPDTFIHKLFSSCVTLIYTFHMPLFFALSGALFNINKYIKFKTLFKNKFKRLVVPYLLVGILYVIPLKFVTGYFPSNHLIRDILFGQFLGFGNTHLWFLMALFWTFIFIWIIEKYISSNSRWLSWICVILLFVCGHIIKIDFLCIFSAFKNLLWFYVGYIFETYRETLNQKFAKQRILSFFALFFVYVLFWGVYRLIPNIFSLVRYWAMFFITFCGIAISYFISLQISYSKNILDNKTYQILRKYSMEIYLYSDPLNYVILYILSITTGLSLLGSESGSLLIIVIRNIGTIVISILLGSIISKIKLKSSTALDIEKKKKTC